VDSAAFAACSSGDTFDVTTLGQHTFRVKAKDRAGNEDPSPAQQTWNVTALSLQTTILDKPAAQTRSTDASFTFECRFAGNIVACTFVCSLDGQSAACDSPKTYAGLAEGSHTFTVVATSTEDHLTDPSPASFTWTIDLTPPVTTITSPASDSVTGPQVTFAYTANEDATFECDTGSGFAPCDAAGFQKTMPGGSQTFSARATDVAGNHGDPASVTWTVDAEGPVVTVTSPLAVSGPGGTLDFTFTDLSPPVTFRCDFGQGFADCAPGDRFSGLSGGSHTVQIEGTDKWGNKRTTPFTWTVDATGPTVNVITPLPGSTVPGTGSITWTVPTADATRFVCTINGAPVACSGSAFPYDLPSGNYTFEIVAFDEFDNPSVSPPSVSTTTFTVDADAPVVVAGAPSGVCVPVFIPFDTQPADDIVVFQCALDNGAFGACRDPGFTFNQRTNANGPHVLRILATDTAGNQSQTVTVNFTVDLDGPLLSAVTPQTGATNTGSVTVQFSSNEPLVNLTADEHVAVPDGADLTRACTAGVGSATCNLLAAGANTVHARAVDTCGNPSGTSRDEGGLVIPGDTIVTAVAPYGPETGPAATYFGSDGHVVLVGWDFHQFAENQVENVPPNAVSLAPFTHRDLTSRGFPPDARNLRVLLFQDSPGNAETAAQENTVRELIGSSTVTIETFNDPAQLDSLLPGYDVLLVLDQDTRVFDTDLTEIAASWANTLTTFVNDGGIVVVTDGETDGEGRTPTGTFQIIPPGLLAVDQSLSLDDLFNNFVAVQTSLRYGLFDEEFGMLPDPAFWVTNGIDYLFNMPSQSVVFDLADKAQPTTVAEVLVEESGCGGVGAKPGCPPPLFSRHAVIVDKLFPAYAFTFGVTGVSGLDRSRNPVTVIPETGTLTYSVAPANVGQSSVECRFVPQEFSNPPFFNEVSCGVDTTMSGNLTYDVTNTNCPECVEGPYAADVVAVTPSTAFTAGEGARAASANQIVWVDSGIFLPVLIVPPSNNLLEFRTDYEAAGMQTFQCSIATVSGKPVADSRQCNCPAPPAVCNPTPVGPGFEFAIYDPSGLGLDGAYTMTLDLKDGVGHTLTESFPLTQIHAAVTIPPNQQLGCFLSFSLSDESASPSNGWTSATCQIFDNTGAQLESNDCFQGAIPAAGGSFFYTPGHFPQNGATFTFRVNAIDGWNNPATDTQSWTFSGCITKPQGGL
jgi:hypothetical protein